MRILLIAFVGMALTVGGFAGDWPQFQGPNRTGISQEKLPNAFPADGPKVLWTKDLGRGFGGAAIEGDRCYLIDRADEKTDVIRCLELKTGKEIWKDSYSHAGRLPFEGSRATPTLGKGHLYIVGGFGHVTCLQKADGKRVWQKGFQKDYKGTPPKWGYSQSALLYKNTVIVAPMTESVGMVALDQKTGEEVWKTKGIKGDAYSSPMLQTILGVEQLTFITKGQVTGINPDNGKILWVYDGYFNKIPIPFITPIGDGRVFITGGYGAGSVMVKFSKAGGKFKISELFRLDGKGSQIHPAILHDGHLYANFNTNENMKGKKAVRDGLVCLDLNGKFKWQTHKKPDFDRGPLLLADGKILALDGATGTLRMAEATPNGYKELGSAKVLDGTGGKAWAPMALSDGLLIVRDQNQMKCLKLK
jgi:outer membrane protein assembly factor BamB